MRGSVLLLILLFGQTANAELFERYRYQKGGCWFYGYRPYHSPLKHDVRNNVTTYNYYIYGQQSAHQGATQYGLSDLVGFYGELDLGAAFHQAGRLADGAQRLTDKATSGYLSMIEATSNDRTKVAAILAQAHVNTAALSAPAGASYKVHSEMPKHAEPVSEPKLSATEQACATCHSAAAAEAKGGGVKLGSFAEFTREQAKIAREYVTRLDNNNCARKAGLSHEAHQELLDYLCDKGGQQ